MRFVERGSCEQSTLLPMTLFKYKSPTRFEYIADILINERLYCAPYDQLNDPFEGIFMESIQMGDRKFLVPTTPEDLIDPEDPLKARVCSLSSDGSSSLLWSLYAQRLEGVCFEVDCTDLQPAPHKVNYTPDIPHFDKPGFGATPTFGLWHKSEEWYFEREYRLIGANEYVSIQGRLRRAILGPRCNKTIKSAIRKLAPRGCDVCQATLDQDRRVIVVTGKAKESCR
jgi:hypothetical protein